MKNTLYVLRIVTFTAIVNIGCINQITIDPAGSLKRSSPLVLQEIYSDHIYASAGNISYRKSESGKILLIPVEGIITSDSGIRQDEPVTALVHEALTRAITEKGFKAVILKIDSPGGTVHASDSVYRMIERFRDYAKIPVYAHIEGSGFSGGYYVALAASHINASPSSMVGSIGVMVKKYTITGLMGKIGIDYQAIKSGDSKDMLAPEKPLTEKEAGIIREQIQEAYSSFLKLISKSRGDRISGSELTTIADGRIYSASQARKYGLTDSSLYFEEFIEFIKEKENIDSVKVYSYLPRSRVPYSLYRTTAKEESDPLEILKILSSGGRNGIYYMAD